MGACGWNVIGCESCTAYAGLEPDVQEDVRAWAVNRLWEWTNQRFGTCELTVHKDDEGCCWLRDNVIFRCRNNEIVIPAPVVSVSEVVVDGVSLDLEEILLHVDNRSILVRGDLLSFGSSWSVTYEHGEPVPPGGQTVAGVLACEYAKALCGSNDCRLPKRVSSIQRQGVVIGMLDNFTNLSDGFTGIFEIDDWIMTQNRPKRRSTASSPDVSPPRIQTWSYADANS